MTIQVRDKYPQKKAVLYTENHYKYTLELLKRCKKFGYTIVTIGEWDKQNPSCVFYSNWEHNGPKSLYCHPYINKTYKNYFGSGAYSILESMDATFATMENKLSMHFNRPLLFGGGCGNGGIQAQLQHNAPLVFGTYFLNSNYKDQLDNYIELLGIKFMTETLF